MRPAFTNTAARDVAERQSSPEGCGLTFDQRGIVHGVMKARQRRQGGFDSLTDDDHRRRRCQPHRATRRDAAYLFNWLDFGLAGAVVAQKGAMNPDNAAVDILDATQHRRELATALAVEQRRREA